MNETNDIFNKLYNRNYLGFNSEVKKYNNSSLLNLIYAYNYYWEGLCNSTIDESFEKSTKIIQESLHNGTNADIQAALHLMQLRMDLAQKNYLAIMVNANSLKSYFKSTTIDSLNQFNILLWSLYHCLASYTRDAGFLYSTFLAAWPESNKKLGLQLLEKQCSNKSVIISTEARYFLGKIYLELEEKPQIAVNYFKLLKEQYPKNKVYTELYEECLIEIQKKEA
ncbi:MAG: hypothetical protein PF517_15975 [Salinivirgaceae bacterium]|nr:hypothetical protein [Salinivirgaceae bacterium]